MVRRASRPVREGKWRKSSIYNKIWAFVRVRKGCEGDSPYERAAAIGRFAGFVGDAEGVRMGLPSGEQQMSDVSGSGLLTDVRNFQVYRHIKS
jgi:hypothetical protein